MNRTLTSAFTLHHHPPSFLNSVVRRQRILKMMSEDSVPEWVGILLREKFFGPCSVHESAKKNEKTFFCLYCCESICSHCLSSHRTHCLLQIRRYVYHDVIRLGDAEKLLNCSLVQPYTTNSAKVVFLKQRPVSRPMRGSGNLCISCYRGLQYPYLFCSLSCKIHRQVTEKIEIRRKHEIDDHLQPRTENLSELQDIQKTPSSVLDLDFAGGSTTASSATAKLMKKKRGYVKSLTAVLCPPTPRCFDMTTAVNRRKGVPHRSPLS